MERADHYVLLLDDYHASDPTFLQSLARVLSHRGGRLPCILVHGSGERAEEALEAQGILRRRVGGVLAVESPLEHGLVERALREVNRGIIAVLTDAVVPCVGVIGSDRGVLRMEGPDLKILGVEWIESLTEKGVVPVLACHANEEGSRRTGEVSMELVITTLASALSGATTVVAFTATNLPGVMKGGSPLAEVAVDELSRDTVRDASLLANLASQNLRVLLTNTTRFVDSDGPIGTLVRPST